MSQNRFEFGARNVAEARATARRTVSRLIDIYLGEGRPEAEAKRLGVPPADARRLRVQLQKLRREFIF